MPQMVADETPEETRERRVAKRVEGVGALMRTPAYIVVTLLCAEPPPGPDPHDETLSKRTWEKSMMRWRNALRDALHQLQTEAVMPHRGG